MQTVIAADHGPWCGALTRAQWKTLAAANLGWMFDGYETFALILTVGVALRQSSTRRSLRRSRPMPGPSSR